jgi:O-antigen/teichoic acid export membrane protein
MYHAAAGKIPRRKIIGIIHWLFLLQLVLLTFSELIYFYLHGHLWLLKDEQLKHLWAVYIYFISISVTEKYSSLLNGIHLFSLCSKVLLYNNILMLAVFSIFYFTLSIPSLPVCLFIYVLLTFIQAMSFVIAYYISDRSRVGLPQIDEIELRIFFTYSLITLVTNSMQFVAYRIDYWILNYYRGEKELGWYSLSVKLVQMFWVLPLIFAGIILPQVAASGKQFGHKAILSLVKIMYLANILAGVILVFSVVPVIPWLFGQEFKQSATLFQILLPGMILFGGATIFAAYFAGLNRLWVNFHASALCLIIILSLDILLIPSYGMKGAAIASSIGYGITAVFYLMKYKMENNISFLKLLLPDKTDWNEFWSSVSASFKKKKI